MQSIFKNKVPAKYKKPNTKSVSHTEKLKSYILGLVDMKKTKEQIESFVKHPTAECIGELSSPFLKQYFDDLLTKTTLEERMAVLKELQDSGVL